MERMGCVGWRATAREGLVKREGNGERERDCYCRAV